MPSLVEIATLLAPTAAGFVAERALSIRFFVKSRPGWRRLATDEADFETSIRASVTKNPSMTNLERMFKSSFRDSMRYHTETALERLSRLKLGVAAVAVVFAGSEYMQADYTSAFWAVSVGLPYLIGGGLDAFWDWRIGLK